MIEYELDLNTLAMAKAKNKTKGYEGETKFLVPWSLVYRELNEINSLTLKQEKKMLIL